MARFKDYKAKATSIAPQPSAGDEPCAALIELPPNPSNHNVIDLRPWLGLGFDDWITASSNVLQARLQSGRYSVATIISFSSNGLKIFLPFLAESRIESLPARPSDLRPEDVAHYNCMAQAEIRERCHGQELLLGLQIRRGGPHGLWIHCRTVRRLATGQPLSNEWGGDPRRTALKPRRDAALGHRIKNGYCGHPPWAIQRT